MSDHDPKLIYRPDPNCDICKDMDAEDAIIMTKEAGPPLSHREIAARIADDVANGDPNAEFTTPYLIAGVIHAVLALVDVLEDDDPLGDGAMGTVPEDMEKHFNEWMRDKDDRL